MGETSFAKNGLLCSVYEDEDNEVEIAPRSDNLFILSHKANKSSVLCPDSLNITSQYLALQQLDAHQRMISRAKGTVDNSAPKSMQSYKSVADRKKKNLWYQQNSYQYQTVTGMKLPSSDSELRKSPKISCDEHFEDGDSLNASSMNKAVQTGMPYSTYNSKTADKISWYLEAISQGELQSRFYMNESPQSLSAHSGTQFSSAGNSRKKKTVRGDIMEWHKDHFSKKGKSFSPKILANNNAASKVKVMRCYNPPFRKKKNGSSLNSSDTFESYDDDDNDDDDGEGYHEDFEDEGSDSAEVVQEETSHDSSHARIHRHAQNTSFNKAKNMSQSLLENSSFQLNRDKEDKYLNFLSKVTEDILRSGVYTDRAIQRTFEFHMQFHQNDEDRNKLQLLLEQILEGLQTPNDETDILTRNCFTNMEALSISRPTTPPERENSSDLSKLKNLLKTTDNESDLNEDEIISPHRSLESTEFEEEKPEQMLELVDENDS